MQRVTNVIAISEIHITNFRNMKFFDRARETESLLQILEQSKQHAQFTILTGRRRIGKTTLVFHAYSNIPFLYFFVSKRAESELCESWQQEISAKFKVPMLGKAS